MYKTNYIKKEIHNFKKELKEIDKKILFMNYGSFYRDERKFINDVDIHCLFKTKNIASNTNIIKDIINNINKNDKIVYNKFYIGHMNYFYRDKYTLNYFEQLYKNNVISSKDYDTIKFLMEKNLPKDILSEKIGEIIKLSWNINEINKETKIHNNVKYDLKKSIEKDNFIWFDLIYKLNNIYIPIEFIIMTFDNFTSKKDKEKKYMGCKLPIIEYKLKNYYNFLKRLKACYEINIIKKYYNEDNENYLINARDILKHVIKQNEYYISQHHQKITKLKLYNKKNDLEKEINNLNNYFKSLSYKLYNEGIENNLIY